MVSPVNLIFILSLTLTSVLLGHKLYTEVMHGHLLSNSEVSHFCSTSSAKHYSQFADGAEVHWLSVSQGYIQWSKKNNQANMSHYKQECWNKEI